MLGALGLRGNPSQSTYLTHFETPGSSSPTGPHLYDTHSNPATCHFLLPQPEQLLLLISCLASSAAIVSMGKELKLHHKKRSRSSRPSARCCLNSHAALTSSSCNSHYDAPLHDVFFVAPRLTNGRALWSQIQRCYVRMHQRCQRR